MLTVTYMVICQEKAVKLYGVHQETQIASHQNSPEARDTSLRRIERWLFIKKNVMLKIIPQL